MSRGSETVKVERWFFCMKLRGCDHRAKTALLFWHCIRSSALATTIGHSLVILFAERFHDTALDLV